ncbi:MAG: hypothetical protein ACI351_05130 [Candidatus Avelusimicrobium sp.]|uniref:hypothetical protein n=1 Tax=Candidatus Avelusimicrobium sp. TaxID=3048833 RepID=UPI003EFCDC93
MFFFSNSEKSEEFSARYKRETESLSRADQYAEKRLKNQIKECQREIQDWQ